MFISTQHDDGVAHFDANEDIRQEDPNSHASLEDLCRSHLVSTDFLDFASFTLHSKLLSSILEWLVMIMYHPEGGRIFVKDVVMCNI